MRSHAGATGEDIGAPEAIRNKVCARPTIQGDQGKNVAIVRAAPRAITKNAAITTSRT